MKTVVETSEFEKLAQNIWTEETYDEFIEYISLNPEAGDLIVGGKGARKVRWTAGRSGKSGGIRVVTYNIDEDQLLLITKYKKSKQATIKPQQFEKEIK